MIHRNIFIIIFIIIIAFSKESYSDFIVPVSADLEGYDVKIGYGFAGDSLSLFGTKEKLNKIAIVISGPERNFLITRREKFYNLWIKRVVSQLHDVSSYESRWISSDMKRNKDFLNFYDIDFDSLKEKYSSDFVDYMTGQNLYHPLNLVSIANNNLFKVSVPLPNNSTIGTYLVNVMSFDENNALNGKTIISFDISHSDFNKFLYTINKDYHKFYLFILLTTSCLTVVILRYIFIKKQ